MIIWIKLFILLFLYIKLKIDISESILYKYIYESILYKYIRTTRNDFFKYVLKYILLKGLKNIPRKITYFAV